MALAMAMIDATVLSLNAWNFITGAAAGENFIPLKFRPQKYSTNNVRRKNFYKSVWLSPPLNSVGKWFHFSSSLNAQSLASFFPSSTFLRSYMQANQRKDWFIHSFTICSRLEFCLLLIPTSLSSAKLFNYRRRILWKLLNLNIEGSLLTIYEIIWQCWEWK